MYINKTDELSVLKDNNDWDELIFVYSQSLLKKVLKPVVDRATGTIYIDKNGVVRRVIRNVQIHLLLRCDVITE